MLLFAVLTPLTVAALTVSLAGVHADSGGPSGSGYVWVDNNAPDPVTTFNWTDITGTGTLIPGNDCDDCADTVSLPFTFNFFDTRYTELDIGTNGLLSFDTGNACNRQYNWQEHPIPHGDADCLSDGWVGNPLIASWFDDLDPDKCGDIYYDTLGSAPDRMFVVQFDHVCHNDCVDCESSEGVTFETVLFEGSNEIKIQYMDAFFGTGTTDLEEENNGGTATTGINKDGSTGLQYSYNTPALADGLAVLYAKQQSTPSSTPTPKPSPTTAPAPTHMPTPASVPPPTATLTPASSPTPTALREAEGPTALPATGGHPPHGGSTGLAWLAATAGVESPACRSNKRD
jgi:hypothetical protein